jgi:hypothetical protein
MAIREAEHAEQARKNAEWNAGRAERERQRDELIRQRDMNQREYLQECAANYPVSGLSGEFENYGDGLYMDAWPTSDDLWPKRIKFVTAECDFCGTKTQVLEVANAADEYAYRNACRSCLDKMFDVFENRVLSQ